MTSPAPSTSHTEWRAPLQPPWASAALPQQSLAPSKATAQGLQPHTHHTLSPEEVGDHFFIQVIHKTSGALVIAATIDEELLPGVLIDEGADLK